MAQQKGQFNIGDLVFVELLKGFSPWPAKITGYHNNEYRVRFFGSGLIANINIERIFKYGEINKESMMEKYLNNASYRMAIEAAKDEISMPMDLSTKNISRNATVVNESNSPVIDDPQMEENGHQNKRIRIDYSEDDEQIAEHQAHREIPAEVAGASESSPISSESATTADGTESQNNTDGIVALERKNLLVIERDFIKKCLLLNDYLQLEYDCFNECEKLLDDILDLQLSRLILLRNPKSVDHIRKLRSYGSGRKQHPSYMEETRKDRKKIKIIRQYGVTLCNKFKRILNFNGRVEFWGEFMKHVQEFEEITKNFSWENRIMLTEDEYQNLLVKDRQSNATPDPLENEDEIIELE
ncbi:uncharacterized protein LOC119689853 [Teleopsis dalmanni]|uniref:uncharacterized protein LOC119689853 n=1 Tax=Teleopsis dalmanni TaxID=139649 RepID=UPI0018CD651F|nr:uncharacterized protein LOC119689853 [Teleopsis dalmanni]